MACYHSKSKRTERHSHPLLGQPGAALLPYSLQASG